MRIISQDEMIDVPYDMTALHIAGGTIRMNMAGETGKGTIIARYSTPEKTKRAMEMLHDAYMDCNVFCDSIVEGHGGMTTAAYVKNNVFRFPREDEI